MSKRTFDDFDEFADDYREIHTKNVQLSGADSFYFAEMKVLFLKQSEKNEALNIIDIGCGDGATELFMQQHFSHWRVAGIDVSEKSISVAKERKLSNAVFNLYDGIKIPADDNSMDIAFIAGVLHHVNFDLHRQLVKEIYRVLKKDGRLYLFEHNPLNPVTKYLVRTCVFDKDARLLGNNYAAGLLKKSGFGISKKDFIIFFPRKGILSRLIFLEKFLKWLPLGGQYVIRGVKA